MHAVPAEVVEEEGGQLRRVGFHAVFTFHAVSCTLMKGVQDVLGHDFYWVRTPSSGMPQASCE